MGCVDLAVSDLSFEGEPPSFWWFRRFPGFRPNIFWVRGLGFRNVPRTFSEPSPFFQLIFRVTENVPWNIGDGFRNRGNISRICETGKREKFLYEEESFWGETFSYSVVVHGDNLL